MVAIFATWLVVVWSILLAIWRFIRRHYRSEQMMPEN